MDIHHDESEAAALPGANDLPKTVKALAKNCMDLIGYRNDLDKAISLLPRNSADRDHLWQNLEEVMASLMGAVEQLAAQPSEGHAELDRKATVLRTILRRYLTEGVVPGPEVLNLSVSLAEDVHRLTRGVIDGLGTV
jgi:hypothetical protein